MLGFGPLPEGPRVAAPDVYSAPVPGALLAVLGIVALTLVALMPATFDVGWLPLMLIGLLLAAGGACSVLMGYAVLSTRIEIARDGLAIAAPGWRACPFPPVCQFRLSWTDVRAVRHRTELYRIGFLPLRLPLEAYAIERRWLHSVRRLLSLGSRAGPDRDRPPGRSSLVGGWRGRGGPAAHAPARRPALADGRPAPGRLIRPARAPGGAPHALG
jgi:hypothetical protein